MSLDQESVFFLKKIEREEWPKLHRIAGVRTVLVVLSSVMVFDIDSIRHKVILSYPDSTVFFTSTQGFAVGAEPPHLVDLLIDLTGPRQRGVSPKIWRKKARVVIGRSSDWMRKRIYDVAFDETKDEKRPQTHSDPLLNELFVQKKIFGLAGVLLAHSGEALPNREKLTPYERPGI